MSWKISLCNERGETRQVRYLNTLYCPKILGKDQPAQQGHQCTSWAGLLHWFLALFWLQQIYSHPNQIQPPLTGGQSALEENRVGGLVQPDIWASSKGHRVRTCTRNPCGDTVWNRLNDLESPSQNQIHKSDVNGNPTQSLRKRSSEGSWVQCSALYLSVPLQNEQLSLSHNPLAKR